jgi:hypothetical protein
MVFTTSSESVEVDNESGVKSYQLSYLSKSKDTLIENYSSKCGSDKSDTLKK